MSRPFISLFAGLVMAMPFAAVSQTAANDDVLAAAFAVDYGTVINKAATSLNSDMDETVQCAGDLILFEMASDAGAPVFKEMAFIYMERGQFLRKSGEEMSKEDRKWMKSKKWKAGIPKSFDAYGKPRFDVLDESGKRAFASNAEECRAALNSSLSESEMAAIALRATLGSIG